MATTTKITVTLQRKQFDEIRAFVTAGEAASVFGFVQHAVAVALHDTAGWSEMLTDALEQTGGPLTEKEGKWADGFLAAKRSKKGGKNGRSA